VVLAERQLLFIAIAGSLLLHAMLLSIRFVGPDGLQSKPADRGLEVILVNSVEQRVPLQADVLAQVNLNGGGNAERGRATSPLPDSGLVSEGALLDMQRQRVAELEQQQARMLAQLTLSKAEHALPRPEQTRASEPDVAPEIEASTSLLARRAAEIAREIADYNKRPVKTQLTPSTRRVEYAMYYTALQQRIEQTGTRYFPERDGKKMYGELIVYIPVFQDGSIYEKEGGPRVERSSGNAALDQAALLIVRRAAPFGAFPLALRGDDKTHVWEIVTRFHFTRDQTLESRSTGVLP
jgi:periplasmic protein TonB